MRFPVGLWSAAWMVSGLVLTACGAKFSTGITSTLASSSADGGPVISPPPNSTPNSTPISTPDPAPAPTATPAPAPASGKHLVFSTQPGGGGVSVGWPQQPVVTLVDGSNNTVPSTANVSVMLQAVSGSASLRGLDPNLQAVAGVAKFSNLSASASGTYQLVASAPGFASVTSNAFTINPSAGTTYYVSPNGSDSSDGKTQATAWKTVSKVNAMSFVAGDSVLFQGGQKFAGCLVIGSKISSTAAQPFTIGSYGSGQFELDANCTKTESPGANDVTKNQAAVNIGKISGFVLQDCILRGNEKAIASVNPQPNPIVYGAAYGILFNNAGYQSGLITSEVTIQRCDISGFYTTVSNDYGGNIFFNTQGPTNRISILDNVIHGASGPTSPDDNGIGVSGNAAHTTLKDVVVQGNHIYNIGARPNGMGGTLGNGIVLAGQRILIENNVVHDTGALVNTCGGAANIWAASADQVTIQYNEVYRSQPTDLTVASGGPNAGGCDWDGFDLDINVTNSIIQYNYSHDNFGAGYLAYMSAPWGPNTYRYNLSVADGNTTAGAGAFTIADYSESAGVVNFYNNVLDTSATGGLSFNSGGSKMTGIVANNVFRTGVFDNYARFTNTNGFTPGISFINNLYWSPLSDSSMMYFNWAPCSPYNVCRGIADWQKQVGQDPRALALTNPGQSPMQYPSSTITCSPSQITSARDGSALVACVGSNYRGGASWTGSGLNLSQTYSIDPGVRDFYGNLLTGSANLGAYGGN